jgi:hypothetical protein
MAFGFGAPGDPNLPSKEETGVVDVPSDGPTTGGENIPPVDEATEKRLLRKLDIRIIPCVCWIYLMNFMDRGERLCLGGWPSLGFSCCPVVFVDSF